MHTSHSMAPSGDPADRAGGLALLALAVATASVVLLAAGCGSSSPPTSSSQSPQDGATAAYRYAACMRNHGVPNFPNPQVSVTHNSTEIRQVVPASFVHSPQGKAAEKACRGLMPDPSILTPAQLAARQHAREQALFAFATCLRGHGVPGFPDPTPQGQLTLQMISAAGVDLHAPGFLAAGKACVGTAHGVISLADVERAANGGQ